MLHLPRLLHVTPVFLPDIICPTLPHHAPPRPATPHHAPPRPTTPCPVQRSVEASAWRCLSICDGHGVFSCTAAFVELIINIFVESKSAWRPKSASPPLRPPPLSAYPGVHFSDHWSSGSGCCSPAALCRCTAHAGLGPVLSQWPTLRPAQAQVQAHARANTTTWCRLASGDAGNATTTARVCIKHSVVH